MKVSYYPGCSLEGTAREFGDSVEGVAESLGVELEELPDWNCCGASSAHVTNDKLAVGIAARNLEIAEKAGMDLIVPCAMCFSRLKVAQKEIMAGHEVKGVSLKSPADIHVKDSISFFWEDVGEETVRGKAKRSLEALSPVCYYGCLTSRPPRITDSPRPEDPQTMDELLGSLGAKVKKWSYKTDCCGGSFMLSLPEVAHRLIGKLLDKAQDAGADCIVAACPMCQTNLDSCQQEAAALTGKTYNIPVFYFTELMGLAFGHPDVEKWLGRHHVDPVPFLKQKGLI